MVHVTNLNDEGPGSLREALSGSRRMIVFDVAGEIMLEHDLIVLHPFITIDGTTASPPGITLREHGFVIHGAPRYHKGANAHDIIITHLRIRDASADGIGIGWGAYNVVVDHVSVHGVNDGGIDITHGAHDATVQWSIVAGAKGKNMLIKTQLDFNEVPGETKRISLHHNLLTSVPGTNGGRNPRISNVRDGSRFASEVTADVRNNIVANWRGGIGTDVECGGTANITANLFTSPSSSANDQAQAIELRPDGYECYKGGANRYGGYAYVEGNINHKGESQGVYNDPGKNSDPRHAAAEAYPAAPVAATDACSAARAVASQAGVRPLDSVDAAYFSAITLPSCAQ